MQNAKSLISALMVGVFGILVILFVIYGQYLRNEGIYKGIVEIGFESHSFVPCGGAPQWWFSGPEASQLGRLYDNVASTDYRPVYAEVRGTVSPSGEYGHMGAFEREINIIEVLRVDADVPAECK